MCGPPAFHPGSSPDSRGMEMGIPEVQVLPNTWVGWAWLGFGSTRTSPTPLPLSYTDIDLCVPDLAKEFNLSC